MLTITINGQTWHYWPEHEVFRAPEQDGAEGPVYRTYDDWQRIFPA